MQTIQKYLFEAQKADSLLDRAYLFLEDGDKSNALAYFERVLDQNARSPFAYLGKLLVAMGASNIKAMALYEHSYTENADFVKALRFSEGELHEALEKLASERDACEEAYKRACEAEEKATEIEAFVEVYQLYEKAGDFADAKAKIKTIKEALSVLAYYSAEGFAKVMTQVEGAHSYQVELESQMANINALIRSEETMLPVMKGEVAKREMERANLGWFKKKRKLELDAEIEEGKKAIDSLENSIQKNKRKRSSISAELSRTKEKQALANAFGISLQGVTVEKGEGTELPALVGVELLSFDNDKEPFRLLSRKGVLGIVAKNALALYALLQNEEVIQLISKDQKNADAVGSAPVFAKIAPLSFSTVKKCAPLQKHLPVALRVAIEAASGDIVTLGCFPEDGRDPYRDIIPLPGTPYVRPGKPVQWKIIKRDYGQLTLIPTKPLLYRNYEVTGREEMTWANSEMRKYMQGEMFDLLFQGEERDLIVAVQLKMQKGVTTDKIILPSFEEVAQIYPDLPKEGHIWTRDYIEISTYNTSLLVNVSVFSLKYKEKWRLLVHEPAGLLPVVTIKIPKV